MARSIRTIIYKACRPTLSQYKVWLTKIAALEEGFDAASIGK